MNFTPLKLPPARRKYVKVESVFDETGYVQPKQIIWPDGRVFPIEAVRDFRPAATAAGLRGGDCYTVIVRGQERLLFFERTDPRFASRLGRWFVELPETAADAV